MTINIWVPVKVISISFYYRQANKTSSFTGTLAAGEHSFPFQFLIPGEFEINFSDLFNLILPCQRRGLCSSNSFPMDLLYQRPRWRQWKEHAGVIASDSAGLFPGMCTYSVVSLKSFVSDTKQTHPRSVWRIITQLMFKRLEKSMPNVTQQENAS